jgi:hypothetical protein
MDETPRERTPAPGDPLEPRETTPPRANERIERVEVVERGPATNRVEEPRGTPMWVWLLPLVLVVMVLAWFIFTRAEPSSPFGRQSPIQIQTPAVGVPEPAIQAPTVTLPASPTLTQPASPSEPAGPAATPGAADDSPAAAEPAADPPPD